MSDPEDETIRAFYRCPECQEKWSEDWEFGCNSECPSCTLSEIEPYYMASLTPTKVDYEAHAQLSDSLTPIDGIDAVELHGEEGGSVPCMVYFDANEVTEVMYERIEREANAALCLLDRPTTYPATIHACGLCYCFKGGGSKAFIEGRDAAGNFHHALFLNLNIAQGVMKSLFEIPSLIPHYKWERGRAPIAGNQSTQVA